MRLAARSSPARRCSRGSARTDRPTRSATRRPHTRTSTSHRSTAVDNAGHNCSIVTEAESLIMAKEHLIEEYGTLRYTIGTGCSGGSLVQQQVANAYPGVYQGILPQCSFPDAWSTGQQLAAYHFDRAYFENPGKWAPGIVWTPDAIAAVEGHPNHGNAIIFDSVYWTLLADPTSG